MRAAFLTKKKTIELKEIEKPSLQADEVLIRVKSVGICGSDVHYYEHFGMGESYQLTSPQVLGHEPSGIIVEVGEDVKNVEPGQRVTVEPGETCGECEPCRSGHYNLCPHVRFLSTPDNKGAFAEYLVMESRMVFPIPEDMSFDVACLAEPISVGITACQFVDAQPGRSLLVIGVGSIGLLTILVAQSFGITNIIACDMQQNRLDIAKRFGAKHVVDVSKENVVDKVGELTDGWGVDACIEVSGSKGALNDAVDCTKMGGSIALIGIPTDDTVPANVFDIVHKELHISGVFRYKNSYPVAIELLHRHQELLEEYFITNRYPLDETERALSETLYASEDTVKNIVFIPEE